MTELTIVQAVNLTLFEEMRRNKDILVLGEDIGRNGGVFRATEGLIDEFGMNRIIDTPLNESGIIGFAIGLGLYGLKPVAEIQFADFIWPAADQMVSELAKFRYRTGGEYSCPVVVRAPYGGGIKGSHYHSQSIEAFFVHNAGIKVVIPSNPYDTKGLLTSALREPDPVLFLEPKSIYRAFKQEVPEGDYTVPIGKAAIPREGTDVTIIAYGAMIPVCLEAANICQEEHNISCEIVDLRTLMPYDLEAIEKSVKKTGRVVVVYEAPKTLGYGAEISATIAEKFIEYLESPILRVAGMDTPFPFTLEMDYLPDPYKVTEAVIKSYKF
ncbi:MAG: 2-oxoisovalerate dehydrogenase subunit beta [Candidatus Heimdallarchaeota archaeon LC_3]|nr:MAG: 2-oxoisovalerate dehydrogenase subunit beta [Candidatus Heimdallarchaeota archaeon LC_3]